MQKKRLIVTALMCFSLSLSQAIATTVNSEQGNSVEDLYSKKCADCHGEEGRGVKPTVPKLAGQHPDYLYKQLRNYMAADGRAADADVAYPSPSELVYVAAPEGKLPVRRNPIYFLAMNGMVEGLSDREMKALSVYLSRQRRESEATTLPKDEFLIVERLYRAGDATRKLPACASCHGPSGAGIPAQFPRLSGQYPKYLVQQLKNFRSGHRDNDPNGMMRDIAYKLTDDEISSLAKYVSGLR